MQYSFEGIEGLDAVMGDSREKARGVRCREGRNGMDNALWKQFPDEVFLERAVTRCVLGTKEALHGEKFVSEAQFERLPQNLRCNIVRQLRYRISLPVHRPLVSGSEVCLSEDLSEDLANLEVTPPDAGLLVGVLWHAIQELAPRLRAYPCRG